MKTNISIKIVCKFVAVGGWKIVFLRQNKNSKKLISSETEKIFGVNEICGMNDLRYLISYITEMNNEIIGNEKVQ